MDYNLKSICFAAFVIALPEAGFGGCASDDEISAYVENFLSKAPARALAAGGTMEDALCTQAKLVAALIPEMGPVIGYKAALTSKPAQERFGVTEPVRGVLYRDMMLEDGAEVPVDFGARPVFEADLILIVGSDAINDATTAAEAMPHISAVRPFIELPDVALAKGEPINGITLTANGVAAKLGVLGEPIMVSDPATMLDALAGMQVTITASDGEVLAEAPGAAVLGNPVNAAVWLISKGVELKAGDLVSVGSIGPLLPPAKAKGRASVTYTGLPGDPVVSVTFK